jgi:hypothetical protein
MAVKNTKIVLFMLIGYPRWSPAPEPQGHCLKWEKKLIKSQKLMYWSYILMIKGFLLIAVFMIAPDWNNVCLVDSWMDIEMCCFIHH